MRDPRPPAKRDLLAALAGAVAAAAVSCLPAVAFGVAMPSRFQGLAGWDHDLVQAAVAITRADPDLRAALIVWQEAFQPYCVYAAAVPVVAWVWWRGARVRAWWAAVTMGAAWQLALDIKLLVRRARPLHDDPVSHAPGFSFPSGHAFNTTAAVVACTVAIWPLLRGRMPRALLVVTSTLVAVVTALDRVLLGVHFPSDVTVGMFNGAAFVGASWWGFHQVGRRRGVHAESRVTPRPGTDTTTATGSPS